MVLRLFFLVCLISAPLPSLSQGSGKAKPRVPVTKPTEVVSKAGIVYVVGDVRRPTSVIVEDTAPITVLKALANAEGTNPTASLHNAKILRKGENGRTEVPIDIKKILQAKDPDVTLQADDILFVPHGTGKGSGKQQGEHFYDVPPSGPLQALLRSIPGKSAVPLSRGLWGWLAQNRHYTNYAPSHPPAESMHYERAALVSGVIARGGRARIRREDRQIG